MKPYKFTTLIFLTVVILCGGRSVFAQSQVADRNFEAVLYVVVGSDEAAGRGDLPKAISNITRQIREDFSFGNYRLMNTYVGRLANTGSLDYKSISSSQNSTELDSPSFLDWQLTEVKADSAVDIRSFRFGARVPITVGRAAEGGKPITSYETVGLTLNKLSIAQNTPTLVGTISLPRTAGTVFLIMSVRPV